ncbi:MAG: hypothetical protein AB7M12_04560 [Hyphomonadaceae bacterium]
MRVLELTPVRFVVEDTGTGWGVVCLCAGIGAALLPVGWPPLRWLVGALAVLGGGALAIYGAMLLGKTRTVFDRVNGAIDQERWVLLRVERRRAWFYEVEEVLLQRGPRAADPFHSDPAYAYCFRPALRIRGQVWPLAHVFRDNRSALSVAQTARSVLDVFAIGPGD